MKASDLEENFTYHPPKDDQAERYEIIRGAARDFGTLLCAMTPESAEQTMALRKLQEVVFWSNASIAINEADS